MNPETYCGASDEHVHFNNQQLNSGEPIKLFGIDGVDEKTLWLDMKNCTGTLDSITFSLLPNLEYINMKDCNFEQCSRMYASLEKLNSVSIEKGTFPFETETFEGSSLISLSLQDIKIPENSYFQHLNRLETITFDSCIIQNLNKDLFTGLSSLKGLSLSNCKICIVTSDVFDNLTQLEGLNIRDSEIEEINFEIFAKLQNLKFFSFHDNKIINGDADYTIFEQLPLLSTIHFDLDIYETVNLEPFSHLEIVKIGFTDDEENPKVSELVDKLHSRGLKTEYVFCGTLDCDLSDMEECC